MHYVANLMITQFAWPLDFKGQKKFNPWSCVSLEVRTDDWPIAELQKVVFLAAESTTAYYVKKRRTKQTIQIQENVENVERKEEINWWKIYIIDFIYLLSERN